MKRTHSTSRFTAVVVGIFTSCLFSGYLLAAPPTAPGTPTGSVVGQRVNLQWAASEDDNEVSGYNVYLNESYLSTVFDTRYSGAVDTSQENAFYITAFDNPLAGEQRAYSSRSADVVFPLAGEEPVVPDPGSVDTQMPSVPTDLKPVSASVSAISISWAPSSDNVRVVGYNVYRQGDYLSTVFDTQFTDNEPLTDEVNLYSVVAFDRARNFTPRSSELEVNVNDVVPPVDPPVEPPVEPPVDETPPSRPTRLALSSADTSAIAFTWEASSDNVGVLGYSVYRNSRYIATVKNGTSYEDTNLPETGTFFSYVVRAFDEEYNFSLRSSPLAVSISEPEPEPEPPVEPPAADVTPPSVPAGLTEISALPDSINISWDASTDDREVLGYAVYRNGGFLASVRGDTQYLDADLPEDVTQFVYRLKAFDGAFNFSDFSDILAVLIEPEPPIGPEPPVNPDEMVPVFDPTNRYPSPDINDPFGLQAEIDPETAVFGGPPTTPKNLRFDLVSNDWAEINWAPSNDDLGVAAYNIYRSDGVVYVVSPDETNANGGAQAEIDKYWSTTSFIDCNYTRFDTLNYNCRANQPVPGETYTYRVSAVDDGGQESPLSEPLSITYHLPENAAVPLFEDFYKLPDDRFAQRNDLSETRFFLDEFDEVFSDDFNGTELDATKWQTELTWQDNTIINGEQQYFVRTQNDPDFGYDPFSFDGEALTISAIPTPANLVEKLPPICDAFDPTGNDRCQFLSGALSSHDRFAFIYGYVEGRMKVGGTPGMLSSFYLYHRYPGEDINLNAPEIDIIEYLGENPFGDELAFQTYHFDDVTTGQTRSSPTMSYRNPTGELYSDDYHTYGVLWEPQLVIWYIDGKEVKRLTGPMVSRQPMNIVNYLVAGSSWAPTPDLNNPDIYPLELEVDYIKVFQRDAYKSTAQFGDPRP